MLRLHLHIPTTEQRGASFVEVLIMVAVVALAVFGAAMYVGGSTEDKAGQQGATVQCINGGLGHSVECGDSSSDGSGDPRQTTPRGIPGPMGHAAMMLATATPAALPSEPSLTDPREDVHLRVQSNDPDLDGRTPEEVTDLLRQRIREYNATHDRVVDQAQRAQTNEWNDYSDRSFGDFLIRAVMDEEPPDQFRWDRVLFDNCMRQVNNQIEALGDDASLGDLADLENQAKDCLRAQLQRSGDFHGDYADYLGEYADSGDELVRDIGTTTAVVVVTVVAAPVVLPLAATSVTAATLTAAGTVAGGALVGCGARGGINAAQGNDGFWSECREGAMTGAIDAPLTLVGVKAEMALLSRAPGLSPRVTGMVIGAVEGPIDCALRAAVGIGGGLSLGSLATCAGSGVVAGGVFGGLGRPSRRARLARPAGPNQPGDYIIRREGFEPDVDGYGRLAADTVDDTLRRIESGELNGSDLRDTMSHIAGRRRDIAFESGDTDASQFGRQRPRNSDFVAFTPIEGTQRYGELLDRARAGGELNPVILRTANGTEVPLTWVGNGNAMGRNMGDRVGWHHADGSTIEPALDHAQHLYTRALDPDLPLDETLRTVGELHWTLAHAMPYARGSAATSDMLARSLLIRRGIHPGPWRAGVSPDLEALVTRDAGDFADNYHNLFSTSPVRYDGPVPGSGQVRAEGAFSNATIENGVVTKETREIVGADMGPRWRLTDADQARLASITTDQTNRLRSAFGDDIIPEFRNPRPGVIQTEYRGGYSHDQLDGPARDRASQQMRDLVDRAHQVMGTGDGNPHVRVGDDFNAEVDPMWWNFRFNGNGDVTSWFDPVVVTPSSVPNAAPVSGPRMARGTGHQTVANPATAQTVPMQTQPTPQQTVPMPRPLASEATPTVAVRPPTLDFDPGP